MALLGRPKAGDVTRAQLRIKESKEFKVISEICTNKTNRISFFYNHLRDLFTHTFSFFFSISCYLQNTVDKLVQRANASLLIGTSSWKEQFVEALTVSPGSLSVSIVFNDVFCTYSIKWNFVEIDESWKNRCSIISNWPISTL